jgi:AcrR family transcriptional regulator
VAHPQYLRDKAVFLRVEKRLSIDEIAERLALPKTTIYYWVKDLPLGRPRRNVPGRGANAMTRKYAKLRADAYVRAVDVFPGFSREPLFRDFVSLYLAEGYKRGRNDVSICNSDPEIVVFAARWIRGLTANKIGYSVQYYEDQHVDRLRAFWADKLDVDPEAIRFQPKSNSGKLSKRVWRCKYGVATVRVGDTRFRSWLQAWTACARAGP